MTPWWEMLFDGQIYCAEKEIAKSNFKRNQIIYSVYSTFDQVEFLASWSLEVISKEYKRRKK